MTRTNPGDSFPFAASRRWLAALGLAALVGLTRWPFRSHELFGWDAANFALGVEEIDVATHRPHPPGYIGYVLIARALRAVVGNTNTALVLWNILATALAVVLLARFAAEVADSGRRAATATAAATLLATSPLVWFYGEVAEIYASELLGSIVVASAAWRASRGSDRAMYACLAALAVTAVFKVVTAVLLLPLALLAWSRVSPSCRRRTAILAFGLAASAAAVVFLLEPEWPRAVWNMAVTSQGALYGSVVSPWKMFNRNLRDVTLAAVAGLGLVNIVGLLVWLARDRRLPGGFDRRFALVWLAPALGVFLLFMIAKPGYVLPVLPVGAVVVAGFYARRSPLALVTWVGLQAVVNILHFTMLAPATTSGDPTVRYRDKPWTARMMSDLQPLTATTAAAIAQSDASVRRLLDAVAQACPARDPVVIADTAPVDWRRVMWYLPAARAVYMTGGRPVFVAYETRFAGVPEAGVRFETTCPVFWLAPDSGAGGVALPPDVTRLAGLGGTTPPGTVRVTRAGIER